MFGDADDVLLHEDSDLDDGVLGVGVDDLGEVLAVGVSLDADQPCDVDGLLVTANALMIKVPKPHYNYKKPYMYYPDSPCRRSKSRHRSPPT